VQFAPDDGVSLTLTRAEALVVFEVLQRWQSSDSTPGDAAEQRALWNLNAVLEKTLVEPFHSDYAEHVEAAKAHLLR
jgi:hypothetical protein